MLVRVAPPEHHHWIAERAGVALSPAFEALEVVDDAGRIHGMVGFDGWTPSSVSLHVAVENPAALRRLIRPTFRTVFWPAAKKGCEKLIARGVVLSTNERSLALVSRMGFRFVGRLVDGWDKGVDLVLFEMRRDECRWLNFDVKEA